MKLLHKFKDESNILYILVSASYTQAYHSTILVMKIFMAKHAKCISNFYNYWHFKHIS